MPANEKTTLIPKTKKQDDFVGTELDAFCGINEQNMKNIFSTECLEGLKDADSKDKDRLKKVHEAAAEPSNRISKFILSLYTLLQAFLVYSINSGHDYGITSLQTVDGSVATQYTILIYLSCLASFLGFMFATFGPSGDEAMVENNKLLDKAGKELLLKVNHFRKQEMTELAKEAELGLKKLGIEGDDLEQRLKKLGIASDCFCLNFSEESYVKPDCCKAGGCLGKSIETKKNSNTVVTKEEGAPLTPSRTSNVFSSNAVRTQNVGSKFFKKNYRKDTSKRLLQSSTLDSYLSSLDYAAIVINVALVGALGDPNWGAQGNVIQLLKYSIQYQLTLALVVTTVIQLAMRHSNSLIDGIVTFMSFVKFTIDSSFQCVINGIAAVFGVITYPITILLNVLKNILDFFGYYIISPIIYYFFWGIAAFGFYLYMGSVYLYMGSVYVGLSIKVGIEGTVNLLVQLIVFIFCGGLYGQLYKWCFSLYALYKKPQASTTVRNLRKKSDFMSIGLWSDKFYRFDAGKLIYSTDQTFVHTERTRELECSGFERFARTKKEGYKEGDLEPQPNDEHPFSHSSRNNGVWEVVLEKRTFFDLNEDPVNAATMNHTKLKPKSKEDQAKLNLKYQLERRTFQFKSDPEYEYFLSNFKAHRIYSEIERKINVDFNVEAKDYIDAMF